MKKHIIERTINEAKYIIDTKKTIRELALIFNVSKSTVHKDLQERLSLLETDLYKKVSDILKEHIEVRHIRGGESTKNKYKDILINNKVC